MAGVAFHTLHYLLGLARLGYDVYAIEDSSAAPYNPQRKSVDVDRSYSLRFVDAIMRPFGFHDRWAWSVGDEWTRWQFDDTCYGLSRHRLQRLYDQADAILNLYGCTELREEHLRCPIRIYVETDPVIKQIAIAHGDDRALRNLRAHTHHFTYGENLGQADCPVPLPREFHWRPTRPPVVLDLWRSRLDRTAEKFTTISTWRNDKHGILFRADKYYWSKHVTFLRFQELPRLVPQALELALGGILAEPEVRRLQEKGLAIDEAYEESKVKDVERLRNKGWLIVDGYEKSHNLDVYQEYIHASRAEFTVVNDMVARTNSGWFDPRSICYLAAGKPVVMQDTGFSKFIPTGAGLFSFRSVDEAAQAIHEINRRYEHHSQEALSVARTFFDSDVVLKEMMAQCGL